MATANVNTVPTKADRTKVVFPRKHLVPGERILWEGRPSTLVYFVRPLIILLVAGAVTGLLLGMGALGKDQIGFILPLMIVVLCLFLLATHHRWWILEGGLGLLVLALLLVSDYTGFGKIPVYLAFLPLLVAFIAFVIHFIEWRNTVFAMSDRRIMTQYGVFDIRFADTHIDRVQNVTIVQSLPQRIMGYGNIMFATAGEMGGLKSDDPSDRMRAGGAMIWEDIPHPFIVRKKAEEIIYRGPITYPPTLTGPINQPSAPGDTQAKLIELSQMKDKGLINETEYEAKRKEILERL